MKMQYCLLTKLVGFFFFEPLLQPNSFDFKFIIMYKTFL